MGYMCAHMIDIFAIFIFGYDLFGILAKKIWLAAVKEDRLGGFTHGKNPTCKTLAAHAHTCTHMYTHTHTVTQSYTQIILHYACTWLKSINSEQFYETA